MITPKNINNFKQNKPTHIVRDLEGRINDANDIYTVLLARGVFKWFSVRRRLIKLKEHWKARLKGRDADWSAIIHGGSKKSYLKGYRAALRDCIHDTRALCHSPRWAVQDNDSAASRWLYDLEDELKERILESQMDVLLVPSDQGLPSKLPENAVGDLGSISEVPIHDKPLESVG